jgi:hypothetical protein
VPRLDHEGGRIGGDRGCFRFLTELAMIVALAALLGVGLGEAIWVFIRFLSER